MSNQTKPKTEVKKVVSKIDKLVAQAQSKKEVKEQISFKLPADLVKRLRKTSDDGKVNMTALVEVILDEALPN